MVGTSGSVSERVVVVTPSARKSPVLTYAVDEGQRAEENLHLSAEQVDQRRGSAPSLCTPVAQHIASLCELPLTSFSGRPCRHPPPLSPPFARVPRADTCRPRA